MSAAGKELGFNHQRTLHVLMDVATDRIAGEGKGANLIGFKRHVNGLSRLNSARRYSSVLEQRHHFF
jgi:hypothetical protein